MATSPRDGTIYTGGPVSGSDQSAGEIAARFRAALGRKQRAHFPEDGDAAEYCNVFATATKAENFLVGVRKGAEAKGIAVRTVRFEN